MQPYQVPQTTWAQRRGTAELDLQGGGGETQKLQATCPAAGRGLLVAVAEQHIFQPATGTQWAWTFFSAAAFSPGGGDQTGSPGA